MKVNASNFRIKHGSSNTLSCRLQTRKSSEKEAEQITSIYTTDPDGRFITLEDLKLPESDPFEPDIRYRSDDGRRERGSKTITSEKRTDALRDTSGSAPKLKELDLTYFDYFENVDFLSECDQIETLEIRYNKSKILTA